MPSSNMRDRFLLERLGAHAVYIGYVFPARVARPLHGLTDQGKKKRRSVMWMAMTFFKSWYSSSSNETPIDCRIGEQYLLLRRARNGDSQCCCIFNLAADDVD